MAKKSPGSAMSGKKSKTPKHPIKRMTIEHGGAGKGYVVRHEYKRQIDDSGQNQSPEDATIPIGSQDELQQHIADNMPEGGGMPAAPGAPQAAPTMAGGQ